MIKFKSIFAKNFMSIGNNGIKIRLDNMAANLIIGKNGSGKSSILTDTLSFALYGKPYRDINKPLMVNSINKKNMLVEAEFEIGTKEYLIRRGMKPAIFEVYENGKLIDQDDRTFDYQTKLENDILKMNYTAFKQIVIIGKATYVPFMSLRSQARRDFIEDLLSLKIYTKMALALRDRNSNLKKALSDIDHKILSSKEKLNIVRESIKKALKSSDELVRQKEKQLNVSTKEKEKLEGQIDRLSEELNRLQPIFNEIEAEIKANSTKMNRMKIRIEETIKQTQSDIKFFEHTQDCPTCTQKIEVSLRDEKLTEKNVYLGDLRFGLEQADAKVKELDAKAKENAKTKKMIDRLNQELLTKNTSMTHVLVTLNNIERELTQLTDKHNDALVDANQIEVYKVAYEALLEEKKSLQETQNLHKVVSHILKDTGIKAQIIKQYIPVINQYIDKYLSALDFYIQFEIDENFNEIIKSRHRDKFVYNSFSEGEKLRIDVALILVWRAIAKHRNSCSTNLLILDEVFDSSLDTDGVDDLMKLVELLIGEKQTVFVISHRGEQLIDRFENVMKVSKNKGFTQVEYES